MDLVVMPVGAAVHVSHTAPAAAQPAAPRPLGGDTLQLVSVPARHAGPGTAAAGARPDAGLAGMVDKLRADFDAHRSRIAGGYRAQTGNAARDMAGMVDSAIRAQVEIFDTSIVIHAALTVSQQSQNAVKTLIEKG